MYVLRRFFRSIWRTYISKLVITLNDLKKAWKYAKAIGKGHALSDYYAENFWRVFERHLCKGGRESWRIRNLVGGIACILIEIFLIVELIGTFVHPSFFGGLWRLIFIIAVVIGIPIIKHNWTQVGTVLYSAHMSLINDITNGAESAMTAEGEEELALFDDSVTPPPQNPPPNTPAPAANNQNPPPSQNPPPNPPASAANGQNPPPQPNPAPAQAAPHSNCPPGTRPYNG